MACSSFCSKICTRKVRQFLAAGTASNGALVLGSVIGWTAATFKTLVEEFDDIDFNQLWTLAILGALLGLIPAGYLAEKLGRRFTLLVLCIPAIVGWFCIALAGSSGIIYFGRFLTGFSGGGFSVVVPLYLAEVSENSLRGMLGSMFHQQVIGGALLGLISGDESWRLVTWKTIPIPVFMAVGMYFMPESPIYLLRSGKSSDALDALKWLRATKDTEPVDREYKEIQDAVSGGETLNLFKPRGLTSPVVKPFAICMVLMVCNVLSGVGIFTLFTMSFTTPLTTTVNNSSNYLFGIRMMYLTQGPGLQLKPHIFGIIMTAVSLISIGIFGHLSQKCRRRPFMIVSSLIMSIALTVLGVLYFMQTANYEFNEKHLYWIKFTTFLFVFIGSGFGLGPAPFILFGEILPVRARGVGSVLVAGTFWITTLIFTYTISIFIYLLGIHYCFWFFAAVCAFASLFTFLGVYETSGKSFSEIQEYYNSRRTVAIQMA